MYNPSCHCEKKSIDHKKARIVKKNYELYDQKVLISLRFHFSFFDKMINTGGIVTRFFNISGNEI